MIRVLMLFLGALATLIFATLVLVVIPDTQLPAGSQASVPLLPYTEKQLRGRQLYLANGCYYCHSQQIRDPVISTDTQRGWGRPSYPSDYIYDEPAALGTQRTGPDLINVGERLASRNWHLLHLYQPRAVASWSIMPPFPFLFAEKEKAEPGEEVLTVPEPYAPKGKVVVVTAAADDLVAYLLSLKRGFPPPELAKPPGTAEKREGQ